MSHPPKALPAGDIPAAVWPSTKQKDATPSSAEFRQSRVFAEGWKAARAFAKKARNPYASDPERSRWLEGYRKGAG